MTYTLYPKRMRGLLPTILGNVSAVILLYFGVKFIFTKLSLDIGGLGGSLFLLLFFGVGVLALLDALQVLRIAYIFNYNQVFIQGANRTFVIRPPQVSQNIFDKLFGTCSISVGDGRLDFVPYDNRIITYIHQLAYYRNI
ncbi:MAG: hypothetical protein ABIH34_01795 [Nanoarchaeota archaeon]